MVVITLNEHAKHPSIQNWHVTDKPQRKDPAHPRRKRLPLLVLETLLNARSAADATVA